MGQYSSVYFKVPDLSNSYKSGNIDYSNPSVKEANKQMIRGINSQYGSIINFWSNAFELPPYVVMGFIATESGGKMVKPNVYNATGLMQVTPIALYECVTKWENEVDAPLPQSATNEINKKAPELLKSNPSLNSSLKNKLANLLWRDASFNVMSGCLVLRWLLDRFSNPIVGGQLNKTMVAYNAGAYTKALVSSGGKPITALVDTLSLATNRIVPLESRSYLYKMLGKDGFLSLLYQQKTL